jgi:plasmid stabilization system protein ParE
MKILWSEKAREQVREIVEFIAEDRPLAAERILEDLLERVQLLTEFPEQGTTWGAPSRPDLRSIISDSYRIVYRFRSEEIAVLSIRHTRMEPETPTEYPET